MELYILILNNIVVATSFFILGYYASEWRKKIPQKKEIKMPSIPSPNETFKYKVESHEDLMERIKLARTKK